MSFASFDNLISSLTADKYFKYDWSYITNNVIAPPQTWFDHSATAITNDTNIQRRNAFAGTSLAWTPCNESAGNGTQIFGIPHGGNVSPDTKHVLNVGTHTYSTAGGKITPGELLLVDLQGYWPNINFNTTSTQNLTGTPGSNLRYANGAGCRLYFVCTDDTVIANVAANSMNIDISYTNQTGTTGRNFPFNVSWGPTTTYRGNLYTTGLSVSTGPFLPLANGDTGVANVASVTFSVSGSSSSTTGALCLARPLLSLPLVYTNTFSEKDFVNYFPSLPRVVDGACLVWLQITSDTNYASTVARPGGFIEFGWG